MICDHCHQPCKAVVAIKVDEEAAVRKEAWCLSCVKREDVLA